MSWDEIVFIVLMVLTLFILYISWKLKILNFEKKR